jgi:hypothetical protein
LALQSFEPFDGPPPKNTMPYDFIVGPLSSGTFAAAFAAAGGIFWLIAYVLMIRKGFQDSTYGIPLLAIMLNFTWEIIYTTIHAPTDPGEEKMRLIWLAFDLPNVWLLIRYGKTSQKIPYIQANYFFALGLTFVLCFVGHLAYYDEVVFMGATQSAYVINYIMSVLFVFLYFNRPDMKGLSYGGAWTKMLGTTCLSLANIPLWPQQPKAPRAFLYYLFAACFLFDVFYIVLLRQARRSAVAAPISSSTSST